jgi:putative methionine-R-sulfoxide reductase with GAF domain
LGIDLLSGARLAGSGTSISTLAAILVCLLNFFLLARRQLLIPRLILPLSVYALTTFLVLTGAGVGIHDEAMLLYPLAVSMAGLLLGRTGIIVFGVLVVLTTSGMAFGETQGWIVSRMSDTTTLTTVIVVGFINSLTTAMIYILTNILTNNLNQAQAAGNQLTEANLELNDIRSSLASQVQERTAAAEAARSEAEASQRAAETQMWLATGQAQLAEEMRGDLDLVTLANQIVRHLCRYLGAQTGVLFLAEEGNLHLTGSYAYVERPGAKTSIPFGEGLVGQAARDHNQLILDQIPAGAPWIASGLGESLPRQVLIAPLEIEGRVVGVLELATLGEFTTLHQVFISRSSESIAIAFRTAQTRERFAVLLAESQRQTEELQAQEEELRAVNEELQAQAESLGSRARHA